MPDPDPSGDGERGGGRRSPSGVYHARAAPGRRGADQLLWRGEVVDADGGPVRCSGRDDDGPPCGGLLGWPPVGAKLVHQTEPGARLEGCERRFVAFRCSTCKRISTFALPEPGQVAGEAGAG